MDLSWIPKGGTGHMISSLEVINFWKDVKRITKFKQLMEIGFNAGHSSAIILELFPDVTIDSYDIGQFDVTHINGAMFKEKYKDRFNLTIIDSLDITPEMINNKYDIIFIDGAHDLPFIRSDLRLALESDIHHIIVDDNQNRNVAKAVEEVQSELYLISQGKYPASTGKMIPIKLFTKR